MKSPLSSLLSIVHVFNEHIVEVDGPTILGLPELRLLLFRAKFHEKLWSLELKARKTYLGSRYKNGRLC